MKSLQVRALLKAQQKQARNRNEQERDLHYLRQTVVIC